MSSNLYIVPHDFTKIGDLALNYGMHLGKTVGAEIQLLHIVANQLDVLTAKSKLEEIIKRTETSANVILTANVQVGSIFDEIGKIATKERAQLIIMGTHGEKGMQKLFGSYAIKVITSCEIPFLVVEEGVAIKPIKKVVVPIDLTKESLQIVNTAGGIASMYDGTVHVIGEKQRDELMNQQMKNRILIVKKQYEEKNVECVVEFMKDGGTFHKKIMDYAKIQDADMIAFAYHSESLIPQLDKYAQHLITNPLKLPCLVINSKPASALYF
jgi:nucleotide-binding universal stress UspA family protein